MRNANENLGDLKDFVFLREGLDVAISLCIYFLTNNIISSKFTCMSYITENFLVKLGYDRIY